MPEQKKDWTPYEIDGCQGIFVTKNGALLVKGPFPGDDDERWIPVALINDDSEVYEKETEGKLVVPMWVAKRKGLI